MKIACIQYASSGRSKADNIAGMCEQIATVADSDLVVLPELWPTGYFQFDRYEDDAEPLDGSVVTAMREAAQKHDLHLCMGSFVERSNDGLHNTTVLISPDGNLLATYRKMHLFGYESREQQLLTAGNHIAVAETPWGSIGLATCYDLRFPELFRAMQARGASLFLVTSAWPEARLDAWQLFVRARAHENLAALIACNAAGVDGDTQLAGHSLVVNAMGQVVAQVDERAQTLVGDFDVSTIADVRANFPALQDRKLP